MLRPPFEGRELDGIREETVIWLLNERLNFERDQCKLEGYQVNDCMIEDLFHRRGHDYAALASSIAVKYRGVNPLYQLVTSSREKSVYQMFCCSKVWVAAYSGDKVVLESLLALEGTDVNAYNEYLGTPLYAAVYSGNADLVKLLLERGADPNNTVGENGTPLIVAVREGNERMVRLLLQHKKLIVNDIDIYSKTALWWSCALGHVEITRLLMRQRAVTVTCTAAKDDKCVLWRAVYNGHEELIDALLNNSDVGPDDCKHSGETLLWWAVRYGHASIVRLLLQRHDVDPNAHQPDGSTPLWEAVILGRDDIVGNFLQRQDLQPNLLSYNGSTPLLAAINGGHEAIVRLLLDCKAVDPNLKGERGHSPLSRAAQYGRTQILKLLLAQKGIEINPLTADGRTPLGYGCQEGHEAVVRLLLAHEDTILDKDKSDCTHLRHAASSGNANIVRLLLDRRSTAEPDRDLDLSLIDAIRGNHVAVVQVLLEHNANVHVTDEYNRTPLDLVKGYRSRKQIKKLLLERIQLNRLEGIYDGSK
ncbi:Ankyrin repeat domain-containing protein 60 [Aspergillus hancockii]|nr:Ankyrin repeat domain-containing protein 60 [Aspergillus hancockii]